MFKDQVRFAAALFVLVPGLLLNATLAQGAVLVLEQGGEFELLVEYYCGSPNPVESSRELVQVANLQDFSDQRSISIEDDCGAGTASGAWTASITETQIDLGYGFSTEVVDCGGAISRALAYVTFQLTESANIVLTSQGSWEPTNEPGSPPSARLFVDGILHHIWYLDDEATLNTLETLLEPGEYVFAITGGSLRGLRTVNGGCLSLPGTTQAEGWARLRFESGTVVTTQANSVGELKAQF